MEQIKRIKELTLLLNQARDEYYNNSNNQMSDYEYDNLFDELQRLEKENDFIMNNSPTSTVGYEVKSKLDEVTHNHPMLSLDKTKSVEKLKQFANNRDCLLMWKLDGLTISLKYNNGELISAETRGNGLVGEDITHNAKVISNIPKHINFKGELIVDGEAIITYDDFEKINNKLPEDKKYKNPRNLVSGSIRQLDSKIAKERNIKFIAWKVVKGIDGKSFSDRLNHVSLLGFTTVPLVYLENDCDLSNIEDDIEFLKDIAKEKGCPIDGLVLTYDDIAYGESLGQTEHHPRHSLAFKFYDEEKRTILRSIEFSMGRTGNLTPVAIFDTVEIDGTEVNRASLHNINILRELKLGVGDEITVIKANQIIPQIKENLTKSNTLILPEICPICGAMTQVIQDNESKVLRCTNPNCKGKLLGKLSHFVSKAGMDIEGLSEKTLNKLIAMEILHDFRDIYDLNKYYDVIVKIDGFGVKSAKKLLKSISHSAKVKMEKFLYSLGIDGIGKSQSKVIAKYFDYDWDKFENALKNNFMFTKLDGFGSVLHFNIYEWYEKRYVQENIPSLLEFINFEIPEVKEIKGNDLTGLTFVITGSLNRFKNRDAAKAKIEELGGKVSGSVSSKTTYLVNNDVESNSGKNKKAKELGVEIITEEQLIEMVK